MKKLYCSVFVIFYEYVAINVPKCDDGMLGWLF
jgi:hypothetical protein